MRSNYEEKRANRIERYNRLASKFEGESTARYERFHKLLSVIPMGQPILVGHHSEKGHRRLLDKADNAMRASIQDGKKAAYYAEKAVTVENNDAISSDNPNALELLRAKLDKMVKAQELYKAVNKIVRSKKTEAEKVDNLVSLGVKQETAIEFIQPDRYNRLGIPSYKLTNNNANMKTVKQRIAKLEQLEASEDIEKIFGNIRIFENATENRVQIFFPGKPSDEIRSKLKSYGFRWAPTEKAWQAFYSNRAKYYAEQIVKAIAI